MLNCKSKTIDKSKEIQIMEFNKNYRNCVSRKVLRRRNLRENCMRPVLPFQNRNPEEDIRISIHWKRFQTPTGFRRWVKVAKSSGLWYTCFMGTWKSKTDTSIYYNTLLFFMQIQKEITGVKAVIRRYQTVFLWDIWERYPVYLRKHF